MDAFEITVKFDEDEFDEQGRLNEDRIFYYFQKASEADVNYHGIGPAEILKRNQIWVLTKMRVLIEGKLEPGVEYICGTFPVRKKNVTFKRDYYIIPADAKAGLTPHAAGAGRASALSPQGAPASTTAEELAAAGLLVKGASQWCVLDYETRRPLRVAFDLYEDLPGDEEMIPERFPKIRGNDPKPIMNYVVSERDIDYNGHMNNSRYIVLAEEATGENIDEDLYVNFASEVRLGEEIFIYSEEQTDEEGKTFIYVEGRKGNGQPADRVFQILFR